MALLKIQRFFGAVPNELLNNPDISFKAKGLFAYLNSKPDNWDFSVEGIASQVKEGIDSVRAGIHELESFGYLKRIKHQNEKGFWEIDYMLFEYPMKEESSLGKSNEGKPTKQYKKEDTKKEYTKKEEIPPLSPQGETEGVDFRGLKDAVQLWLKYKAEKKQKYKSNSSVQAMINKLYTLSNGSAELAIEIIEEAMSNNYQGFFALKNKNRDGHHNVPPAAPSRKLHESFNFKITNNDI